MNRLYLCSLLFLVPNAFASLQPDYSVEGFFSHFQCSQIKQDLSDVEITQQFESLLNANLEAEALTSASQTELNDQAGNDSSPLNTTVYSNECIITYAAQSGSASAILQLTQQAYDDQQYLLTANFLKHFRGLEKSELDHQQLTSLSMDMSQFDFLSREIATKNGSAQKQYRLALYLMDQKRYALAKKWLGYATAKNHYGAQFELSKLLRAGIGGDKNIRLANILLKRAALEGNEDALLLWFELNS